MIEKKKMLMFISQLEMLEVSVIIPTLSWVAEQAGMVFEAYLGSERDGVLFAKTGSTVLGGNHFQQFNYLNAYYDICYCVYGPISLFDSSIQAFSKNVIVRTESIQDFYCGVQDYFGLEEEKIVLFDMEYTNDGTTSREFFPYFYPEVLFQQAWGYIGRKEDFPPEKIVSVVSPLSDTTSVETLSAEIAHRYEKQAKGVAFGDPDAILSMMATLCRDKYVALYGSANSKKVKDIEVSAYTEQYTCVMEDIKQLTEITDNYVLVGRQIGDGDLFEWGKHGICIKIMDPNRPAFPSVSTIPYRWANTERCWDENEPSDEQLIQYAKQGKILSTLVWHSGEMAHNEAMINLMELASFTGIKMGIGAHAARYQTSPQLWELLSVERSQGGVWGLIEPILHCGGMGVMAECGCPPEALKRHCVRAMKEIEEIAGKAGMPKGYMAFMDTDLKTLTQLHPELYHAVEEIGLDYFISSALPGRNRILYQGKSMIAFNLTPRNVCIGSPYVRMSVMEDIVECERTAPGWIMGVLDSPVVSFTPYIWNRGSKFMEVVNWMVQGETINVLPHTISRYIRILKKMGYIE